MANKVINIDFRNGSITERINNLSVLFPDTPNIGIVRKEKGLAFNTGVSTKGFYVNKLLNGTYTLELVVKLQSSAYNKGSRYLFDARMNSGVGYLYVGNPATSQLTQSGGTIYVNNINNAINILPFDKYVHLFVTGITITTGDNHKPYFMTAQGGSNGFTNSDCLYANIYEGTLTEQERANAYKDFLNSYPRQFEKYPNTILKPMDLSSQKENTPIDIINGWNFTDASWTTIGTATKTSSVSFSTSGGAGALVNNTYLWKLGVRHRIRGRVKVANGVALLFFDANAANTYYSYTGTGSYANIDVYVTINAVGINGVRLQVASGSVEIEYLSIEALTGLVAAYNFSVV